jgi:hypothetical protein
MKTLGVILIVIGGLMTIFTGFNLVTKEEVVDVGPLEINKEERTPIAWSPIIGGIILIAGIVVLVTSKRNT